MAGPTVLFLPESAYGPTNNCIGIADVLRRRGASVVFAAEASWRGRLEALGFEEDLVDLAPPPEGGDADQDAGAFWRDFIRDTAPEFRRPTIEQLATFMEPTWRALVDGARYCEPQLRDIVARARPDVIVEDNVVAFPALLTADVPFVRIVSCNPLEVPDAALPPPYSGLPLGDPSQWADFRAEYDRTHRPLWTEFDDWVRSQGAPGLPDLEFMPASDTLNLYVYPEALDYPRSRPLGPTWHRLESSVRGTDAAVDLPAHLTERPPGSALVYLSLGSLGSADVELLQRLVDVLAPTPHRYVVSLGPQHEQITLPDTMWGADFLPQPALLPLVDLVITHGGNNTTTEAVHHGLPMVVLPLFWDQYDNAQRVAETGLGVRLDTYRFVDADLTGAVDRLLADGALHARLADVSREVRAARGVERAAELIAGVAH